MSHDRGERLDGGNQSLLNVAIEEVHSDGDDRWMLIDCEWRGLLVKFALVLYGLILFKVYCCCMHKQTRKLNPLERAVGKARIAALNEGFTFLQYFKVNSSNYNFRSGLQTKLICLSMGCLFFKTKSDYIKLLLI